MAWKRSGEIRIRSSGNYSQCLYATLQEIQAVWALVSRDPNVSVRRIQKRSGIRHGKVWQILNFLEDAGYIRRETSRVYKQARRTNAFEVIIPFVYIEGSDEETKQ